MFDQQFWAICVGGLGSLVWIGITAWTSYNLARLIDIYILWLTVMMWMVLFTIGLLLPLKLIQVYWPYQSWPITLIWVENAIFFFINCLLELWLFKHNR